MYMYDVDDDDECYTLTNNACIAHFPFVNTKIKFEQARAYMQVDEFDMCIRADFADHTRTHTQTRCQLGAMLHTRA